jgi:hypothetical protein
MFAYSRPAHTQKTLDALKRNLLAPETNLIVYLDAPKSLDLKAKSDLVKNIIRSAHGFKSIKLIERPENFGLAKNIIEGVTEVCNQYGRAIVLEDDIETSEYFLTFMNDGLNFYRDDKRVYSISGCTYPADLADMKSDTFFLRIPLCWGWATWQDRWQDFEKNLDDINAVSNSLIKFINFNGTNNFFQQAKLNLTGKANTWFIFWYLTLAKKNAVTLFPKKSLANNIGLDGTGDNCGSTSIFDQKLQKTFVPISIIDVKEDSYAVEQHIKYFKSTRIGLTRRIVARINRIIGAQHGIAQ